MSAGGQDMPGGKTRDQWKRQQDEIERLERRIDVLHEHDGTMCPLCAMEREIERLQAALKEIAKYPSIEGGLARDTLEDKNDSL